MHVSSNTAIQLKQAGFPQPELAAGQFWVDAYGREFFTVQSCPDMGGKRWRAVQPGSTVFMTINLDDDGWVFLPTETDILRLLPNEYFLNFADSFDFSVNRVNEGSVIAMVSSDPNAAEACAEAWRLKWMCRKCGGICKASKAFVNPVRGSSEWSDGDMNGATLQTSGEAVLTDCLKCQDCGHSFVES